MAPLSVSIVVYPATLGLNTACAPVTVEAWLSQGRYVITSSAAFFHVPSADLWISRI